jgi:GMP reductase
MRDFLLSYDTVSLKPEHSTLLTRDNADCSTEFCGRKFKLPVLPANMQDVISFENAQFMSENDFFYIMHRFEGATSQFIRYANENKFKLISVSIGTKGYMDDLGDAIKNHLPIDFITIDVAHADHASVKPVVQFVREQFPGTKLIVGNVATRHGVNFLCNLGVDAIKVGIGGGSICTTRYKTGFHLPTLHSVFEAEQHHRDFTVFQHIPIIADGGAKHYGDIAKALTFGATMVMSGGWFASCIDSPARIVEGKKVYRGSTSYEVKGEHRHVEGRSLALEEGFSYAERLEEIKQALQSSISYAGGDNLQAFNNVKWDRIMPFH